MKAQITYTQDKRYTKPIRIEVVVVNDQGAVAYTMDVHNRYKQRDASIIGRCIGSRYDGFSEDWGTIEVSNEPPKITTLED